MLVLARKKNEWVDIQGGVKVGGISICVVEIRGDKVRLGFEADPSVPIHRRSVQLAIDNNEEPKR